MRVPYHRFHQTGRELANLQEVLESGWLTSGPAVRRFEEQFATAVGARHACALNSCTAALHLGLEALGVRPGDKVLVPTMTFTATASAALRLGAVPVLIDVEYGSSLITPDIVRQAIARHPDAVVLMIVHFAGQPAQMLGRDQNPGILDLCRANGIRVLEDAAHAFPARLDGRMVGGIGDVTCFSFYATKTVTTAEGGMLTTDDDAIAGRVRLMRNHGITRDVFDRHLSGGTAWEYDVVAPGYKYTLSDLHAAVGLAQLGRFREMHQERVRCAKRYFELLKDVESIDLPLVHVPLEDHAWHLFVIVLRADKKLDRRGMIAFLSERGVGTAVPYKPLHRMSYYANLLGGSAADFPAAEQVWQGCIALPIYPDLSDEEIVYVTDSVKLFIDASP